MIIVCEPSCKGYSHEKVNAGYLYGLKLAYPKEKILLFAHKSHLDILKVKVEKYPINSSADIIFSIFGMIKYYFIFKNLFDETLKLGEKKIFFLSSGPVFLYLIKKLKEQQRYKDICCTFVLHGELEDIANKSYIEPYEPVIKSNFNFFQNIIKHPGVLYLYLKLILTFPYNFISNRYSQIFKKMFRTKEMMLWKHSNQYKYISMSPHVTKNAQKCLDTKYLNFQTIILPIVFNKPSPTPKNKYIKFAVFGYGDSSQMQKMLTLLSRKEIKNKYEIKIISMDSRGTEGFPNITRYSKGKVLTREEMEKAVVDVDVFINLYDKSRHKFGCSLSILECFSYLKPVLHLSNDGYNYFNNPKKPIGYRCENLDEFTDKMVDMIENYERYKKPLNQFRKNMLEYRREYDIKNNLELLRKSLSFSSK